MLRRVLMRIVLLTLLLLILNVLNYRISETWGLKGITAMIFILATSKNERRVEHNHHSIIILIFTRYFVISSSVCYMSNVSWFFFHSRLHDFLVCFLWEQLRLLNWRDCPLLSVSETNLLLNKLQELSLARQRPHFTEPTLPHEALSSIRLALATNLGRATLDE